MKQSGYLKRQDRERKQRDSIVLQWSCQLAMDLMTLVLNDAEIMGHDTFGRERLNKIGKAWNDLFRESADALTRKSNASHVRRKIDERLQKICGEDFEPWEERYQYWDDRGI
jgi:hypothetical protein